MILVYWLSNTRSEPETHALMFLLSDNQKISLYSPYHKKYIIHLEKNCDNALNAQNLCNLSHL